MNDCVNVNLSRSNHVTILENDSRSKRPLILDSLWDNYTLQTFSSNLITSMATITSTHRFVIVDIIVSSDDNPTLFGQQEVPRLSKKKKIKQQDIYSTNEIA